MHALSLIQYDEVSLDAILKFGSKMPAEITTFPMMSQHIAFNKRSFIDFTTFFTTFLQYFVQINHFYNSNIKFIIKYLRKDIIQIE